MTERDVFLQAIEIDDPAERAAFLDRLNDADLRRRVEALLKAHDEAGGFLREPHPAAAGEQTGAYVTSAPPDEKAGAVVAGRYKLLERIGEGGMGTVWMADQFEPVKRRVAVKLIRSEREGSATILSRFEAERQAIALMDHPNIAKLLDAGKTDSGSPFFVMELVKGAPLTDFCDEHRLNVSDRLKLFIQICSAVQHAHQKGIIHRDLKPTNVLVEMHDDKPVPKVIDFGLAKAMSGQPLTERTLFTGFGAVAGTPLYMAPEQAKFNAVDVDTRADVYALGVILYEMLTGTTPIERATFKQAALDEMLRMIRESEPPTPSKRLSSTDSAPSVAASRQMDPAVLGSFVKGELDWIVMKALAKERDRRYDTAKGFAQDVERFLNHEPVAAGPPSSTYKLRKFVQRHRGRTIAACLVLFTLVTGAVGTSWGYWTAEQARRSEAEQRRSAEKSQLLAEGHLATGLLRPMGYNTNHYDPAELSALEHLASLPEDRLKLRFLEEALRDPETALRFLRRVPEATQAAVGASQSRREAALELAANVQRDPQADVRCKAAACFLTLELGGTDVPALVEAVMELVKRRESPGGRLTTYGGRISPDQLTQLAEELLASTRLEESDYELSVALDALAACVDQLQGPAVQLHLIKWCDELTVLLTRKKNSRMINTVRSAVVALGACCSRLEGPAAQPHVVKCCQTLVDLVDGRGGDLAEHVEEPLAKCVSRLQASSSQEDLVKWCETLLALVGREKRRPSMGIDLESDASYVQTFTVGCLAVCFNRLEHESGKLLAGRFIKAMLQPLREPDEDEHRYPVAAMAEFMNRFEGSIPQPLVIRTCEELIASLGKAKDANLRRDGAETLAACVKRLEEPATQPQALRACETLLGMVTLEEEDNVYRRKAVLSSLVACLQRLEGPEAQPHLHKWCEKLETWLNDENEDEFANAALAACIKRLEGPAAQPRLLKRCDALLPKLSWKESWSSLKFQGASEVLAACLVRLEGQAAQTMALRACEAMVTLIPERPGSWHALPSINKPMVACVNRLEGPAAQAQIIRVCESLIAEVRREMASPSGQMDASVLNAASESLAGCVTRLEGPSARSHLIPWCETLLALLGRGLNSKQLEWTEIALIACIKKLPAEDAERFAWAVAQAHLRRVVALGWKGKRGEELLGMPSEQFPTLIGRVHDRRRLALLLKHSASALEEREAVLKRLDELCIPQATEKDRLASLPREADELTHPNRMRRFRTVWDAVAWLDAHEPGIDWNSPWTP